MTPRILVIRGGAIGDFILTLPALRLLRENFPATELEILGYQHIISVAHGRFYARNTRSIEYGRLSRFFIPSAELDPGLCEYFEGFQQVISYLYDPDGLFESGLRRAGVKNLLQGPGKLDTSAHAAVQLARPLEKLALFLENPAAEVFPSAEDLAFAEEFLRNAKRPLIAIHPGSGSPRKNWPLDRWQELGLQIARRVAGSQLLLVSGEADVPQAETLRTAWRDLPVLEAARLPLALLGAVLSRCSLFMGHDSGISHLAAASGAPSVLLFGPTDPEIWAPQNRHVTILRAPSGELEQLPVDEVLEKALALLG